MAKTERLRRSFFPQAIRLLNSKISKIFIILHHPYCCYVHTLYNLFAHPCLYYYLLGLQYTVLHIYFYCTFYLIARIRCFVSSHDLEKLVHAFITSRVDYCNGLLTGLPKKTIRQLQLIQNAAARILTRTRKSEHITPVLRSLHWLPVTFRIDFKVLLLVYKSLNGLGPKYMSDMLTEYKPNRPLRSLGSSQLEIPRVHTKQGESAFSYYAARSWNQLPEEIKCAKTLATFKSSLKTHLFSCAFVE